MSDLATKIADEMPELSHLRCEQCAHREELGDTAEYFRTGWPKHCGYTMRLITKAEENALLEKLQ